MFLSKVKLVIKVAAIVAAFAAGAVPLAQAGIGKPQDGTGKPQEPAVRHSSLRPSSCVTVSSIRPEADGSQPARVLRYGLKYDDFDRLVAKVPMIRRALPIREIPKQTARALISSVIMPFHPKEDVGISIGGITRERPPIQRNPPDGKPR